MTKWTFTAEPGYFDDLVALAATYPGKRLTTQPNLSLTERSYPSDTEDGKDKRQWARFAEHIKALNRDSPTNVSYKLLYLTRHGEGYHNKKAAEVGEEEWDVSSHPMYAKAKSHLQTRLAESLVPTKRRRQNHLVRRLPHPSRRKSSRQALHLLDHPPRQGRRAAPAVSLLQPAGPLPADIQARLPARHAGARVTLPPDGQGRLARALHHAHVRHAPSAVVDRGELARVCD